MKIEIELTTANAKSIPIELFFLKKPLTRSILECVNWFAQNLSVVQQKNSALT